MHEVRVPLGNKFGFAAVAISLMVYPAIVQGGKQEKEDRVAAAISDGVSRDVLPYALRNSLDSSTVVGWVYTAHVRVARFARAALGRGIQLTPTDIPNSASAPVMHVVMRNLLRPAPLGHDGAIRIAAIRRPPTAPPPGQSLYFVPVPTRLIPAVRLEALKTAEIALGAMPSNDVLGIGVFSETLAQQPFLEFCVYREYTDSSGGPAHDVMTGYVEGPVR